MGGRRDFPETRVVGGRVRRPYPLGQLNLTHRTERSPEFHYPIHSMRTLLTLLNREIRSFFYQPIAYVVMFFLLLVAGFNFFLSVLLLIGQPREITVVELAFNMVPFWIVFILTFPLITMRSYAEEFRQGTFETLTTAP